MKTIYASLLTAIAAITSGCYSGNTPQPTNMIPATQTVALPVAKSQNKYTELPREVVSGLLNVATDRRKLLQWVERDPFEESGHSQPLNEFRAWLEQAASYQPEMFEKTLTKEQISLLDFQPASRQLSVIVRGLARSTSGDSVPEAVKPQRLPSGIDPVLMFEDLFGNSESAEKLLNELVIGFPRSADELSSPKENKEKEWQRIRLEVEHIEARNRELIQRAIRESVRKRRAAQLGVSMARLYAEIPFAVTSWLGIDETKEVLRTKLAELDQTSKYLFRTVSEKGAKSSASEAVNLDSKQRDQLKILERNCQKINEALLRRFNTLSGSSTKQNGDRLEAVWKDAETLAVRAIHLYSLSTAETRINWPGRSDDSLQLLCMPEEKLNEKAAAGVHIAKPVHIVMRDGKLDVAREGAAKLAVLTVANALTQELGPAGQGATIEQYWELDFGVRAYGLTWTVREEPSSGGAASTWRLNAEGLEGASWAVDVTQFQAQMRSLGMSRAAAVDHVSISIANDGPVASASVYFPSVSLPVKKASRADVKFAALDRDIVAAAFRSAERDSLNAQIGEVNKTSDFPSLVTALGGRRAKVKSVRPAVGEQLEFVVEAELQSTPPIPVDLVCQPLANARLAVLRVESADTFTKTLLGDVESGKLAEAKSLLNKSLSSADNLAKEWTDVVEQRTKTLGLADLPPNDPQLDSCLAELRTRLQAALRAKVRETIDVSHQQIDDAFIQTVQNKIGSFIAERRFQNQRKREIALVGGKLDEELMRIRTIVAGAKLEDNKIAAIVNLLKEGLAAEHAIPDDKMPDLTPTVSRFVASASFPAGATEFVYEDELARLGSMLSAALSQHVQNELRKAASLSSDQKWTDEQSRSYAVALQPFLLPIADARRLTLKEGTRQKLTKELETVLSSKRLLLERELASLDLSGMSLEVLWQNDLDRNAIRGIARSMFCKTTGDSSKLQIFESLERLSLAAGPTATIKTTADLDARLLSRLDSDIESTETYKAVESLRSTLADVRKKVGEFNSPYTELKLVLRIDVDPQQGPLLVVRADGRLQLPSVSVTSNPPGYVDQSTVAATVRIFGTGTEIAEISKKLNEAARYTRDVNTAAEALLETADQEISQAIRRDARRELLATGFTHLENRAKGIDQTLQEVRRVTDPKTFDQLVARLNQEASQALAPVEELVGQVTSLHANVDEWIKSTQEQDQELKKELQTIRDKLEKATTSDVLTSVQGVLADETLVTRLETGRTASALKSLKSTFGTTIASFKIDEDVDDAIRDLRGIVVSTSQDLLGEPVAALSIATDGKLNLSVDGLPTFLVDDPRLLSAAGDLSKFKQQIRTSIESRKKELTDEIAKAKKEVVTRATEFRTSVENDLRDIGDQLRDELSKLNLPNKLSLFGQEFTVAIKGRRIEIREGSTVLFAIKASLERPGQPPSFQIDAPVGQRLNGQLSRFLDVELRKLLGTEALTIIEGRFEATGRCVLTTKLQPDKFPIPIVAELALQFQLPAASNGWKFGIDIAGIQSNAEASLAAAIDVLVKDLTKNSEALGIGPVRIDPATLTLVKDDSAHPFRSFGLLVQAKLEVTDGFSIPMQLGLHSRKGISVQIDESTIAALASEALNAVLGDELPLGLKLDTPAFSLDGGLRVYCLFRVEVPGVGIGLGGRVMLSQQGIDFGEAIRLKIPGWYDAAPVSFGAMGASLDIKNKAVSIDAGISISPGEAFRWIIQADATGTISFAKPITLRATGEVRLLQLLTLAESSIKLIPERGSFEVDSKASIGNVVQFKGLFFIEAIHARQVNGKAANIYTLTDLSIFGLNVQKLEAGMNFDLELWASTQLDLAIARVEGEFGFAKGLSSPRLYFEAGLADGSLDDVVDIEMFVAVSEDYVGADVTFSFLGMPTGVYLEFGSLRDLTVGEVLRRLADFIRLELKPPSGFKFVPGPSRDVKGETTEDRPTTTKDEGQPEPQDQPVVGATPNVKSIPAFQPTWTVTEYVITEKDGGLLGTGLFGSTRRVKKYRTDVVGPLQDAFGTNGNALQSTATYYKQANGHILTIDSSRTLRVYAAGNSTPIWQGTADVGGDHQNFPITFVTPADFERAAILVVAPENGDVGLVLAAKYGAKIGRHGNETSEVVNLSKIELPTPNEQTESKKLIEAFQLEELAKQPLKSYVRFAAMLRFRNFFPKELRTLADGMIRIQYMDGETLRTLLHIAIDSNRALMLEDVSPNVNAKEHWDSLAKNAVGLKSLPLETATTLAPRGYVRSVGAGAKRILVFTENEKRQLFLLGDEVALNKDSAGSWSASPKMQFQAVLARIDGASFPTLQEDVLKVLISAQPGIPIHIGAVLENKNSKPQRVGIAYVSAGDGLEHLAILDWLAEPDGRMHDVPVEKLVKFWSSRITMVPNAGRDEISSSKHYMDLLLSGEWAKRGWRANPLGPLVKPE